MSATTTRPAKTALPEAPAHPVPGIPEELPIDYRRFGPQVAEALSDMIQVPLRMEGSPSQRHYERKRRKLEADLCALLGPRQAHDGPRIGDEIVIERMRGIDIDTGASQYFFGGDESDLPLGSKGYVLATQPESMTVLFENGTPKTWRLSPEEIAYTGQHRRSEYLNGATAEKAARSLVEEAERRVRARYEGLAREYHGVREQMRDCIVDLPSLGIKKIATLSVYTPMIEVGMVQRGCTPLTKIHGADLKENEEMRYRKLIPAFSGKSRLDLVLKQHPGFASPSAILVDTPEELELHAKRVYQVSRANWVLSRRKYPGFPYNYCLDAARNVSDGLHDLGYLNAVMAICQWTTTVHGYVTMPFVMNDGVQGLIGCDPTSDQTLGFGKPMPRNFVFIVRGRSLEYPLSTFSRSAYYPASLRYLDVDDAGKARRASVDDVPSYFAAAFKNPFKPRLLV